MKKIINGKKYDTKTAQYVASYRNEYYRNDFKYCYEDLFLKKTGEYFIYGEGGAMSKYAKSCGQNSWCGGSEITPLTEDEAKKWVQKNDNDEYENLFGIVEE